MPRLSLLACAAFSTLAAFAAQPAAAQSAVVDKAVQDAPADVKALSTVQEPIMGSLIGTSDLTNSNGTVPDNVTDVTDTGDWNLDETVGGPMVGLTNLALTKKGYPTLEALGADTQAMQQGMSMDGGNAAGAAAGSALASAPIPGIVSGLVGGILPK